MIAMDIICPRCQQFLNRPAQVDLVIFHKGKVLLLKRHPQFLLDPLREHFWGKYLVKTIGPEVYSSGFRTLPGSTIRREHTLEDAVNSTIVNLLGVRGKIHSLVGVFSKTDRDPKASGVSFCVHVKLDSHKFTYHPMFVAACEWHSLKDLPNDIAFDHKEMINKFKEIKSVSTLKPIKTPDELIRPLPLIPNLLLCQHCGQFNNRPVQTDGILIHQGKLVMIRRQREYLPSNLAGQYKELYISDTFNPRYMSGWHVLPGGYVRRQDTVEETVIREFLEETGLKTRIKRLVGVYSDIDRDAKSSGISVCYQLEYVSGKIKPGAETQEVKLVHLDSLPSPIAFDHKEMIEDFLKASKKR